MAKSKKIEKREQVTIPLDAFWTKVPKKRYYCEMTANHFTDLVFSYYNKNFGEFLDKLLKHGEKNKLLIEKDGFLIVKDLEKEGW